MCSMLELFEQTQRTNKYDQQQSLSTTQADTINHHQGKHSVVQTDRPLFHCHCPIIQQHQHYIINAQTQALWMQQRIELKTG